MAGRSDAPPAVPARHAPVFDVFYTAHFPRVVALTYALSGSRLAAEDLAQEAFVAAYRDWERVKRLDDPAAWVRRVAANRSVSVVRRRVTEAKALVRLGPPRDTIQEIGADSEDVWRAVRALPRRQAQAVALYYLEDRSLEDVARVLECSVETVRTHLRRARRAMADRLRLDEGGLDGR